MLIHKNCWEKCRVCDENLSSMVLEYGGSGVYKTQCFTRHIKEKHGMSLEDYFSDRPKCPCGVCNKSVGIKTHGANLYYKQFACGRNPGVLAWSERAKTERAGKGNPMFGQKAWNTGETKHTSEKLAVVSRKMTGRHISEETKAKQSESAKKRLIHGHTGKSHSEATRARLREATLASISRGVFNQNNTAPVRMVEELLKQIGLSYEREKIVDVWSFDFYISEGDLYLEVDGDYYHSNPKIYPNGPKTATQRKNWYRDIKKNEFCQTNNLKLIRFWECDIIGDIECVKQKLLAALL